MNRNENQRLIIAKIRYTLFNSLSHEKVH